MFLERTTRGESFSKGLLVVRFNVVVSNGVCRLLLGLGPGFSQKILAIPVVFSK